MVFQLNFSGYYPGIQEAKGETMQMMYNIIAQEIKAMKLKAHPQDYLNFYFLGKRKPPLVLGYSSPPLSRNGDGDNVTLKVLLQATGDINTSDVDLAVASKAIILGLNIKAPGSVEKYAHNKGVEIWLYKVIDDLIDDMRLSMEGLLELVEVILHSASFGYMHYAMHIVRIFTG
ncbi:uncharacterized protein [Spinacia oleracea]|uniref:Uncharacterized protein isoform X2 n=1 Tax=Spinacia oleracea TaxID=3562 RepID=A0ABM3R6K8_SPIOL|nr:uncharacterized protein LOC110800131 isoform X2 [Spinacia oleracea]